MRTRIVIGAALSFTLFALGLLALAALRRDRAAEIAPNAASAEPPPSAARSGGDPASRAAARGFLYGRVSSVDGEAHTGRLRFGGDEEAFWDHTFVGFQAENRWRDHLPPDRRSERVPLTIFGLDILSRERPIDLRRPFMARFGDIARIEAQGSAISVTLKSQSTFVLDRFAADDLSDGIRVWDESRGLVDLAEPRIRAVDFMSGGTLDAPPARLHGRLHTKQGNFEGFILWDRVKSLETDVLLGETREGEHGIPFADIRGIEPKSPRSARLTLADGSQILLEGSREVGLENRGTFVEDPRFGRVLVYWSGLERAEFSPAGDSGPAYADYAPGRPLVGNVITRDGRRLVGRLVFDLDESETSETLDAPDGALHYSIPFGMLASISPAPPGGGGEARASVVLRSGEALSLEPEGDLGAENAGVLIFESGADDPASPVYVPWEEILRIELEPADESARPAVWNREIPATS